MDGVISGLIVREIRRGEVTPEVAIELERAQLGAARVWLILTAAHKVACGRPLIVEMVL